MYSNGKEPSILYVEDDPMSREVVELIFRDIMGFKNVVYFTDSANFMQRVAALPKVPDLFFLDVQVQPHNGYDMLKMLQADDTYQSSIIIAMTASVMATDVEQLREVGFDGLIGKPVRQKIFPKLFEQILAREPVWFLP
jgi:CheY-like chemotaxis protein